MGRVNQCCRRICREINVFPKFEYHMIYVLYAFVAYLLTVPLSLLVMRLIPDRILSASYC
jgi:hypothetical protein